jgi:hypothetical protein
MKIVKTELHLSNFVYIAGSINTDRKLRFTLTLILYCETGEPLGFSISGCVAFINHQDRLTWHAPASKNRGVYYQNFIPFKRLHALVTNKLAETKYTQQLKRNVLSYFEKTPGEIDPALLNEPNEITFEVE